VKLLIDTDRHGDVALERDLLVEAEKEVRRHARWMRSDALHEKVLNSPGHEEARAQELVRAKRTRALAGELRWFIDTEYARA
jgi:hypothetical protein